MDRCNLTITTLPNYADLPGFLAANGVEVVASRRLASYDLPGFVKRGDTWVSPNWDTARHRLRVLGRMSVGQLSIEGTE